MINIYTFLVCDDREKQLSVPVNSSQQSAVVPKSSQVARDLWKPMWNKSKNRKTLHRNYRAGNYVFLWSDDCGCFVAISQMVSQCLMIYFSVCYYNTLITFNTLGGARTSMIL